MKRICKTCETEKDIEYFIHGHRDCRDCYNEKRRQYRWENVTKIRKEDVLRKRIQNSKDRTEIYLNQGKTCKVDQEDFDWVVQWKWTYFQCGYAGRKVDKKLIYLHRLIMGNPAGKTIDHINGDTLDNRRENLRICTHAENLRNVKMHKNNTSGYRGVTWDKRYGKWASRIKYNYKNIHLGFFNDPEVAYERYKQEAVKLFGEYARLE